MKPFSKEYIDPNFYKQSMRKPNFENIRKVLAKQKPDRPTLFEFFMNGNLSNAIVDFSLFAKESPEIQRHLINIHTFKNAGYDYVTTGISQFDFPTKREKQHKNTISLNEGISVIDRESFAQYPWMEVDDCDFSALDTLSELLPEGMKLMVSGPCGVLENVIRIVGYENLCYMLADDEELAADVFDGVGSRLLQYYERCAPHDAVGIIISNDDWGFKTQTMLSTEQMRQYVFPWHKKIAAVAHKYQKPVVLHSCGNLSEVYGDIIDDMQFDGKHSYEDAIEPIEQAYEKYTGRIALLGGIDLDFICRSTPEEVYNRAVRMLEQTKDRGCYGLGSGNSIPEYVPLANYLAMVAAVHVNQW